LMTISNLLSRCHLSKMTCHLSKTICHLSMTLLLYQNLPRKKNENFQTLKSKTEKPRLLPVAKSAKKLNEEGLVISGIKKPLKLPPPLIPQPRPTTRANTRSPAKNSGKTQQRKKRLNWLVQQKKEERRKRKLANQYFNSNDVENIYSDFSMMDGGDFYEDEGVWVNMIRENENRSNEDRKKRLESEQRNLELNEQDIAYETSVLMDKSKEEDRIRKEKEQQQQIDKQKAEESQKLLELENAKAQKILEEEKSKLQKETHLKQIEASLPPEPQSNDPNVYHITLQLPNSEKISRKFHGENTIQQIKDFIDIQFLYGKEIPQMYRMISNFPTTIWEDYSVQIGQSKFQKRQLLRVEKIQGLT